MMRATTVWTAHHLCSWEHYSLACRKVTGLGSGFLLLFFYQRAHEDFRTKKQYGKLYQVLQMASPATEQKNRFDTWKWFLVLIKYMHTQILVGVQSIQGKDNNLTDGIRPEKVTPGSICPDRWCMEYSMTCMCSLRGVPQTHIYALQNLSVSQNSWDSWVKEKDAKVPPGCLLIKQASHDGLAHPNCQKCISHLPVLQYWCIWHLRASVAHSSNSSCVLECIFNLYNDSYLSIP